MNPSRTALLIRCSQRDADAVRAQAFDERRTLSACLLNIIERSLWVDQQYAHGLTESFLAKQAMEFRLAHEKGDRTTMLLRCSTDEAARIRAASRKRRMSISEFVVFSLWRYWKVIKKL